MRKRSAREVREEILSKIRAGQRVSEAAKNHGISEPTVRSWLERDTISPAAEAPDESILAKSRFQLLERVALGFAIEDRTRSQINLMSPHIVMEPSKFPLTF